MDKQTKKAQETIDTLVANIAKLEQSVHEYSVMTLQEAHRKNLDLIKKAYDHDVRLLNRYKEELELRLASTPE